MTTSDGLFAHHVPGNSWLHRAPLWAKLAGVIVIGLACAVAHTWVVGAAALAAVVVAGATARLGRGRLLRSARGIAPLLVLLGGFQVWQSGPADAARVVLGIAASVLAAGLLTATTPVTTMLDGVVRAASPLRRWVDPEVAALFVGVVVRSVPWVAGAFGEVRTAARARGLDRSPRALVVPAVLHTVAYARRTGEALAARGLTDPDD